VTGGPYYFTKHPAYITKICAFFLISLPFLDGRATILTELNLGLTKIPISSQGIRNMFMLAGLSFVYWVRAKTEERNLASVDPAYSIYTEQIRARHRRWLRLKFGSK
jgi:protein-S-isoprenylcysteine O-methyltransferase Ste14